MAHELPHHDLYCLHSSPLFSNVIQLAQSVLQILQIHILLSAFLVLYWPAILRNYEKIQNIYNSKSSVRQSEQLTELVTIPCSQPTSWEGLHPPNALTGTSKFQSGFANCKPILEQHANSQTHGFCYKSNENLNKSPTNHVKYTSLPWLNHQIPIKFQRKPSTETGKFKELF